MLEPEAVHFLPIILEAIGMERGWYHFIHRRSSVEFGLRRPHDLVHHHHQAIPSKMLFLWVLLLMFLLCKPPILHWINWWPVGSLLPLLHEIISDDWPTRPNSYRLEIPFFKRKRQTLKELYQLGRGKQVESEAFWQGIILLHGQNCWKASGRRNWRLGRGRIKLEEKESSNQQNHFKLVV